jgi:hypothetical protein
MPPPSLLEFPDMVQFDTVPDVKLRNAIAPPTLWPWLPTSVQLSMFSEDSLSIQSAPPWLAVFDSKLQDIMSARPSWKYAPPPEPPGAAFDSNVQEIMAEEL